MKTALESALNFLTSLVRKPRRKWLLLFLLVCVSLVSCQINRAEMPYYDDGVDISASNEHVIILHGLWRTSFAMNKAESFFLDQGYQVHNLSYPSTESPIEVLSETYLKAEIERVSTLNPSKIHFVTHSMGGILVRYYLQHNQIDMLGRVVMIAPPNHGSELNDVLPEAKWLHSKPGPGAMQLSALPESWVNQLAPVEFHLGIIAGNRNPNWLTDYLIPDKDDGAVSVESTKVEGMDDFLVVPESHVMIRRSSTVLKQSAHFLKYGFFFRQNPV